MFSPLSPSLPPLGEIRNSPGLGARGDEDAPGIQRGKARGESPRSLAPFAVAAAAAHAHTSTSTEVQEGHTGEGPRSRRTRARGSREVRAYQNARLRAYEQRRHDDGGVRGRVLTYWLAGEGIAGGWAPG